MVKHECVECGADLLGSLMIRKYCSTTCKARFRKKHKLGTMRDGHDCRVCGTHIELGPGQANKWLCSDACRRAANARSVREFHKRQPHAEAAYRARTRQKLPPDSQHERFYRCNPGAPRSCESCGERRVVEIAHRPGHERHGARRSAANQKWPEMVWILCPTCHRLLDRMHYSPADLGLK